MITLTYFFLLFVFIISFLLIKKTNEKLDATSWIFYGILASMVWQGLSSVIFYFLKIPLSFITESVALVIGNIFMLIVNIRIVNKVMIFDTQKYFANYKSLFAHIVSLLISIIAGILFFTPDLVPSSMTGDPGRHYLGLNDFTKDIIAPKYKPIYRICCSQFIYFFEQFLFKDQLFVFFNIISLWLVTNSCTLILLRMYQVIKKRYIILFSLLTCFGYPYFALQYGYYTLLLSSAFLFSSIALCLDFIYTEKSIIVYTFITLMITGVILTHSYLLPEALLSFIVFTIWYEYSTKGNFLSSLRKYSVFWLWIIGITLLSNFNFSTSASESIDRYVKVVTGQGFVNESFINSLIPFIILAVPYAIASRKNNLIQAICVFIFGGALFSSFMYILMSLGYVAPYYVNRNQLYLMPLLIILSILGLIWLESFNKRFSSMLFCVYILLVLTPYLMFPSEPLSKSNENFILLKTEDQTTYIETAQNTKLTPLQMTNKDRKLLREIGLNKIKFFGKQVDKLPVIGSDHEVIWFYNYTGIYPSLFERSDGFVLSDGYRKNYDMWDADDSCKFIVIIKHMHYDIPSWIIEDIDSRCNVLLEGDSFKILKKR